MTANSTFLDRMAGRTFRTVLRPDEPVLIGHLVHDIPVLPGVFLIDLVLRILRDNGVDPTTVELRRCVFQAPIAIADGRPRQVRIRIGRPDAEELRRSSSTPGWRPRWRTRPLWMTGSRRSPACCVDAPPPRPSRRPPPATSTTPLTPTCSTASPAR
ncbi:hypothetical protein ACFQ1L_34295 [Phytohabitans flavus]|uniref:hypothetical protein n=1 Tax=Phytohabitans flavus TaxID=1076124 RepID=UPI003645AA42